MPHDSMSLQKAFGYLFIEEVHALKELAQSLPANPVVVNLGAGSGTNSLAIKESRKDLYLYCIDIQLEDSPLGGLFGERKVLQDASYIAGDDFTQIHGDSKAIGKIWQSVSPQVDMIFVDADHSYNGCKGDILAWLPNIKPGGIIAVHDFGKREVYKDGPIDNAPHPLPWPGVDRAVRHYLCPYYEMILKVKTLVAFRIDK